LVWDEARTLVQTTVIWTAEPSATKQCQITGS
jgi:hypothetical protein